MADEDLREPVAETFGLLPGRQLGVGLGPQFGGAAAHRGQREVTLAP